jgi:ATP-dependent DNA ligase
MATVNVTTGMTPEMLEEIDQEAKKCDMSRAEYVRTSIREANGTPFECPEITLEQLANGQPVEEEGAA